MEARNPATTTLSTKTMLSTFSNSVNNELILHYVVVSNKMGSTFWKCALATDHMALLFLRPTQPQGRRMCPMKLIAVRVPNIAKVGEHPIIVLLAGDMKDFFICNGLQSRNCDTAALLTIHSSTATHLVIAAKL